jgi:hypothetical protein
MQAKLKCEASMPIHASTDHHLAADLDAVRADCERLCDTFAGAALLFGVAAAVVALGGLWIGEPLFTVSFAFALTAAVAFGIGARTMAQAAKAAPRIVEARAPLHFDNAAKWRRAA